MELRVFRLFITFSNTLKTTKESKSWYEYLFQIRREKLIASLRLPLSGKWCSVE